MYVTQLKTLHDQRSVEFNSWPFVQSWI